MMTDYLEVGSVPYQEDCAQIGADDYYERTKKEIARYRELIIKKFGEPPEGCWFRTKANPHDFGTYHELAIYFNNEEGAQYAYAVESKGPKSWNDTKKVDWRKV